MEEHGFALTVTQGEGYTYTVTFDDPSFPELLLDEPEPLGEGKGPNAARILAAAVGNCLSASFQYCLKRARVEARGLVTRVEGTLQRNSRGRFRINELRVVIEPTLESESEAGLLRCMDLFEDYCIVTESVRSGIDVLVEVRPRTLEEEEPEEVSVPVREPVRFMAAGD